MENGLVFVVQDKKIQNPMHSIVAIGYELCYILKIC
jgi:hypothetical protein